MWLVEQLRQRGRIDVAAAAAEFGTAEMTIRRDLDALAQQGVARRVRGGAVSLLMRGEELPFAMREMSAAAAKQRIGTAAGTTSDSKTKGKTEFILDVMAARKSGASGVTSLGKNARTRPSLPIRYFAKFHAGRCPLAPRKR